MTEHDLGTQGQKIRSAKYETVNKFKIRISKCSKQLSTFAPGYHASNSHLVGVVWISVILVGFGFRISHFRISHFCFYKCRTTGHGELVVIQRLAQLQLVAQPNAERTFELVDDLFERQLVGDHDDCISGRDQAADVA